MAGQCTQYFEAMGVPNEKKVLWAAMALKGDALNLWFSWKGSNKRVTRWTFENAVLKGFQPEVWVCVQDSGSWEQENRSVREKQRKTKQRKWFLKVTSEVTK